MSANLCGLINKLETQLKLPRIDREKCESILHEMQVFADTMTTGNRLGSGSKVSDKAREKRSREVFIVESKATNFETRVIGWDALLSFIFLSEGSVRVRFSNGRGTFNYYASSLQGVRVPVTITRTGESVPLSEAETFAREFDKDRMFAQLAG